MKQAGHLLEFVLAGLDELAISAISKPVVARSMPSSCRNSISFAKS